MQEKVKTIDDVLEIIKPFGRYQILLFFIYICACFLLCINSLFMGYAGLKPKWICTDQMLDGMNSSKATELTDSCDVYEKCSPENLTFITPFNSVASEWGLVCDNEYFISLITSVQMVGQLIGSLVIGPISDSHGRKWIFFITIGLHMFIGALGALATSPQMFLILRFIVGLFVGASGPVAWIFTAEMTTNRYRLLLRMVASVLLPFWNQLLIVYFTRSWRWYAIIANLEPLPILIIIALFTYESPRWLVQKGRTEKSFNILNKIARFNKTELCANMELESEVKVGLKKYYVWDLFRTKQLAIFTSVCLLNAFAANMAYYGMYFNMGNLSSNIYTNTAIVAAILMLEIPLAVFDTFSDKANRKYMMISFFALASSCDLLIILFQTVVSSHASGLLIIIASSIGQVAAGSAMDLCYIYAVELFPTLLRSNAQGLMGVAGRLSGAIAPQILYAGRHWAPWPYICFGAISVVTAVVDILFLPDTRKLRLPETYQQANQKLIVSDNN